MIKMTLHRVVVVKYGVGQRIWDEYKTRDRLTLTPNQLPICDQGVVATLP